MTAEELSKLTPAEKRVKIAEAVGWKRLYVYGADRGITTMKGISPAGVVNSRAPNHPASVDAMAEAEKTLTDEQHSKFREELFAITSDEEDKKFTPGYSSRARDRAYISATAAQRADAFLLTI